MHEYISKGNAIFAVSDLPLTLDAETTQRAIEVVRAVPAADVRPVVRGKWQYVSIMTVRCSNCKDIFHELGGDNFCPNCGADMREVSEDG